MSVYSTLTLKKKDALKLIAEHLNIEIRDTWDENELIAQILFKLSSENPYSPFWQNNYWVVDNDYTPKDGEELYNPDERLYKNLH